MLLANCGCDGVRAEHRSLSGSLGVKGGVSSAWTLDPQDCWQIGALRGLEVHIGTHQRCKQESPVWSLCQQDCSQTAAETGWSPVTESFQNWKSKFCRLTSRGSWTVAERGWSRSQDTSGSVTKIKVCMPITWCTCRHNFSWIPWHIELVTEPKPNGAGAKTSGLEGSFQVCS